MTRGSEDFHGGDAVLCMPRDLFKEGGHSASPAFRESSQGSQEVEGKQSSRKIGIHDLQLLAPHVSNLQHHSVAARLPPPASNWPLMSSESTRCHARLERDTAFSSSAPSPDVENSPCIPSRDWRFQVIASLRAKPCSLASDVIAAIDFDDTGSRFATGGIARKIRVCSYDALVRDHMQSEISWTEGMDNADEAKKPEEERQLLGPHGRGRSCRSSRFYPGMKRKIPEADGVLLHGHDEAALRVICTPAKLSSLKWRPFSCNVVGCGDYDGVVTEWDVEQGLCLSERYEHSGQRIWSVDYSSWFPTLCASASGDGTVRLWTLNCERSVGIIRSPGRNSICCAEFSADGPHRVAVACADSNVYMYDMRRLDSSLLCLWGHERAASYVRFLGSEELVSASIDSSVKLWDVSSSNALSVYKAQRKLTGNVRSGGTSSVRDEVKRKVFKRVDDDEMYRLRRTFNSHRNVKNFVGLSVRKGSGLIACGSESNEVFVYDKRFTEPIWQMKFHSDESSARQRRCWSKEEEEDEDDEGRCRVEESKCFVGAVCWREHGDHLSLLSANSQGTLQLVKVTST